MPEDEGRIACAIAKPWASSPSADEVRAQLARILGSIEFVAPERARSFLRYVVEQTLAGHADRLKGYNIATAVFQRDAGFDAQADPVVRMEAGRLRRALERYYLVAGQADPVLIEVPKGGYVPTFACRPCTTDAPPSASEAPPRSGTLVHALPASVILAGLAFIAGVLGLLTLHRPPVSVPVAESAVPDQPTLLVVPFTSLGDRDDARLYAAGVTEEILTQLSRYKDLAVLGRETTHSVASAGDAGSIARELAARYALSGSLRISGSEVRVASRLVDTDTGTVLWAQTYEEDLRAKELFAIQENIALRVATAVAQPYGVVFQSDLQRTASQPPDDLEAYACTLRFYVYRARPSAEAHALVCQCLERAVDRYPGYATAWAMSSLLALDEDRFAFNPRPGEPAPIERATLAARRAVDLDADNARALQALMMTHFFRGEVKEAVRVGELAMAAHPHDSELLSEFGVRVALAGEWQRGQELVERALARDPAYAGYYHAALGLIAYMQRDLARAEAEIRQADLTQFSIYHGLAAIVYAERGHLAEARREAALFSELHPAFLANLDAELRKRNLRREDRLRLVQGLLKAGVAVPAEVVAAVAQPPEAPRALPTGSPAL